VQFSETIFMTGFPGFIAGRLVERLSDEKTQFLLLVQQQFIEKAAAEIEYIAAKTNVPLEDFIMVAGDITLPDLGIGAEDLEFIRNETTDVFHLAAIYDLGVSRELAQKVNLTGTRNVNDFVKSIGNLKRYNYISTCYVAGKREGVIRESELEHHAGFRNFYEETKYLAEAETEKLKGEFPVTIFRPSVVCGDSRTGETAKYDGVYYLINYLRKFPALLSKINIGNERVKLNLVPVDFVVDAIAALSKDERAAGQTIQLADPDPLTTAALFTEIAKALSGSKPAISLPAGFCHWLLMLPYAPSISGLPYFGVPYFFIRQTYDTQAGDELLATHKISCPPFASYVKTLCDFVEKHPKL
jgi:nucleoside-diphosphate-sugar epimerase